MGNPNERIPFFEPRFLKPLWALRMEEEGCTVENVEEFALSLHKPAPRLRDQPPSPPKPVVPEPSLASPIRVNTPVPPEPTPQPALKKPRVKPFDLQDIPDAMERIGWPMSAKVMRKWFAGELTYADTDDGAKYGINHKGEPFPPSMIDTTMFKLDWILGFARAKKKYDQLVGKEVYSDAARDALKKVFGRQKTFPYDMSASEMCGGDMHKYHREFQFQRVTVDAEGTEKFLMFLRGATMPHGLWMDDLYGSLGGFSINAAVDRFAFYQISKRRVCVKVYSISLYMRDVFTFHDRDDSARLGGLTQRGSQYLGHWNKKGFVIVPSATALSEITAGDWVMSPVAREGVPIEGNIYYPIRNKDYRDWQLKHRQGGDLIIYSDRTFMRLPTHLVVEFDR